MARDTNIFTLMTFVHKKIIFLVSKVTTGSDDRKLAFTALNQHWNHGNGDNYIPTHSVPFLPYGYKYKVLRSYDIFSVKLSFRLA